VVAGRKLSERCGVLLVDLDHRVMRDREEVLFVDQFDYLGLAILATMVGPVGIERAALNLPSPCPWSTFCRSWP